MPFVYWVRCVLGILPSRWQQRVKSHSYKRSIRPMLEGGTKPPPPLPSNKMFLDEFVTVLIRTFRTGTAHCV